MFKNRKIILIVASLLVVVVGMVGCSNKTDSVGGDENIRVTLVLDEGGVNDQSFNQSAWEGAIKAKGEYGVDVTYLESKQESDYLQTIETAIDNGSDLVVGVGFKLADKMLEVSRAYPDTKFAMIDATYEEIPSNMSTVTFNEEEAGYLAGLVIGKMASANVTKFGFIGGMDIPTVTQFAVGYEKALKEINPKFELKTQIANSFTDAAKGRAIANQMYNEGIETIFTTGGGVNIGVIESAKELGKYVVGVDMPMSYLSPEQVVTSALKNINFGVENIIKETVEGNFKGGVNSVYDLANGGVGYEKTGLIPEEVAKFVDSKVR